jgi:hypothetical protein
LTIHVQPVNASSVSHNSLPWWNSLDQNENTQGCLGSSSLSGLGLTPFFYNQRGQVYYGSSGRWTNSLSWQNSSSHWGNDRYHSTWHPLSKNLDKLRVWFHTTKKVAQTIEPAQIWKLFSWIHWPDWSVPIRLSSILGKFEHSLSLLFQPALTFGALD